MSDTVNVVFLGQRVEHLQSELRTIKEDIKGIRLTMVTRQDWVTDRDAILARLENLEAEMTLGFRQLNEKMDRQHAAILDLLKRA
jgi:hypothetical protein